MKDTLIPSSIIKYSMENALEIIFLFEKSGQITIFNKTARQDLQYEKEPVFIYDIFPNSFQAIEDGFESALAFGNDIKQLMAYRKNKTCFPVQARLLELETEPISYLCMASNTSEQTLMEKHMNQASKEAKEAQQVKSEFIANVTHELRTPVNGILGNIRELIQIEDDTTKKRLLHLVEHGCQDMNAIINSILDFSKLEAGKFTLEPRQFHFRNMIDYVRNNHIPKITEKGLDFFVTVSPDLPKYIIGDELRIVQILNNLLSNACKFTSVGKINLEVVKTGQINNRIELFFIVIDTGIGIKKADIDKLFKSFSQVDASITRKYGGTGLGLNICKQLVELMDGTIQVDSERGKGSMFSFHIWVEVPNEEVQNTTVVSDAPTVLNKIKSFAQESDDTIWTYGTPENLEEIHKKMSKLILSMEMDNWEKTEIFAETIKQLTADAPIEIKSTILRLKMAVQKEDYNKAFAAFEVLKENYQQQD